MHKCLKEHMLTSLLHSSATVSSPAYRKRVKNGMNINSFYEQQLPWSRRIMRLSMQRNFIKPLKLE